MVMRAIKGECSLDPLPLDHSDNFSNKGICRLLWHLTDQEEGKRGAAGTNCYPSVADDAVE